MEECNKSDEKAQQKLPRLQKMSRRGELSATKKRSLSMEVYLRTRLNPSKGAARPPLSLHAIRLISFSNLCIYLMSR
jgi:hypothetical protein